MFDADLEELQVEMSANKYISITQVCIATATKDLLYLHEHRLLITRAACQMKFGLNFLYFR
ncbi:MAG: hypothetical protein EA341_02070 [Mongoliibacter sp.]|nr:MAG: hypothetical protein EA341_02070 [Mongoliibacter sp.]